MIVSDKYLQLKNWGAHDYAVKRLEELEFL